MSPSTLGPWLRTAGLLGSSWLAAGGLALAAPPNGISYQGLVLLADGSPYNAGHNVTLRLYDDPVSTDTADLLYAEIHLGTTFVDGVFSVVIGAGSPLLGQFGAETFATTDVWLEVEALGEILSPRTKLQSVAYALQCTNAQTLGGLEASSLQRSVSGV